MILLNCISLFRLIVGNNTVVCFWRSGSHTTNSRTRHSVHHQKSNNHLGQSQHGGVVGQQVEEGLHHRWPRDDGLLFFVEKLILSFLIYWPGQLWGIECSIQCRARVQTSGAARPGPHRHCGNHHHHHHTNHHHTTINILRSLLPQSQLPRSLWQWLQWSATHPLPV